MLSVIAIILSCISIVLMLIILVRFKKLFSTDSIIDTTKNKMNQIIIDVNNNTKRDLELINEATRRTSEFMNEANKKMKEFHEATQRLREMIAEAEKLGAKKSNRVVYVENDKLGGIKPVGQIKQSFSKSYINPDDSFSVTKKIDENGQQSLFEQEETSVLKDETKVTKDGAAYKEVPLIITKVYDEKMIDKQKSPSFLNTKIEKLFNSGMQIEDIASELSCSISEVQFIIDMLQ